MSKAILQTDGGSRGNPGIAGLGFTLKTEQGEHICDGGCYLENATNNVAEYSALIWGLKNALERQVSDLEIYADSELVVKQINGIYKVKSKDLQPLYEEAKILMTQFSSVSIAHVYRSENTEADKLANEAMDAKGPVGSFAVFFEATPRSLFDMTAEQEVLIEKEDHESTDNSVVAQKGTIKGTIKGTAMNHNTLYEGPGKLSGQAYEHTGGHYELTVKDHFDAAHTLPGYPGPCQYLHGHTWEVEVTIAGEQLDDIGILYDFNAVKDDLHAILENFDHRYINDVAPFDILNPTAEHLARVIFFELEKSLTPGVSLKEVAVWESPVAKVVYRP